MPTFKGKNYTFTLPDYPKLIQQGIRQFLPSAGKRIVSKTREKIGTYQAGWKPLAESTKQRKARRLRGSRKVRQTRMSWGTDTPLLDSGKMRNSVRFGVLQSGVEVTADNPMIFHEQDLLISGFDSVENLPRRPVMVPALEESLEPLANELEIVMGSLL